MVLNKNLILDEGMIKNIADVKMVKDLTNNFDYLVYLTMDSWRPKIMEKYYDKKLNPKEKIIDNPKFINVMSDDLMRIFQKKYYMEHIPTWVNDAMYYRLKDNNLEDVNVFKEHFSVQSLQDYLGIIPFTPSVMINISPHWQFDTMSKGIFHRFAIELLRRTINSYLKESGKSRYNYWKFVIECGSEGDFIHAHIVAHVSPDMLRSVIDGKNSHIAKNNHCIQLKKWWAKHLKDQSWQKPYLKSKKGYEGCLNGKYSIQRSILRNQQLVEDKLKYLIEEHKPDGHKNMHHAICPLVVEELES